MFNDAHLEIVRIIRVRVGSLILVVGFIPVRVGSLGRDMSRRVHSCLREFTLARIGVVVFILARVGSLGSA